MPIEDKDRVVVGTFQSTLQLTDKRHIVITGHIYNDDTAADINRRVDENQDVLDRQLVRCDLTNKRAQRIALMQHLEQYKVQLENLKMRQTATGSKKLSSQEKQSLENGDQSLATIKKNIDMLDLDIADAEKKLAA